MLTALAPLLTTSVADVSWAVSEPAGLLPARQQMALSLGWHIVLACFGVALPTIIAVVHWRGAFRGDHGALLLAKRWGKVSAVLFAIGAVSGTVLGFEMGLLWPGLMGTFGDVVGLAFAFEGLSFFIEAIFLGMYLYAWGRMDPRRQFWMLVPMGVSGISGTFFILSVNAWMNSPVGFDLVDGEVTNVNPWAVFTNDQVWMQFLHMWLAAFMVAGFTIAAVYAAGMLRGRSDRHHRLGFMVPFAFATVAALMQPFVGHLLGLRVAETQPAKLAAFELALETESPSPLRLGGVVIDGEVVGSIDVPVLGSVIARNSLSEAVQGMDTIPSDERPPINLVHLAFQTMVGIGSLFVLVVLVYWGARWRGRDLLENRWFLRTVVTCAPLSILALEAGWIATEVGRQPWVVYGVMRTTEAAGDNPGLWWLLGTTTVVYTGLTIGAVMVLRSMARRWRTGEEDLPSPYGPEPGDAETGTVPEPTSRTTGGPQ